MGREIAQVEEPAGAGKEDCCKIHGDTILEIYIYISLGLGQTWLNAPL